MNDSLSPTPPEKPRGGLRQLWENAAEKTRSILRPHAASFAHGGGGAGGARRIPPLTVANLSQWAEAAGRALQNQGFRVYGRTLTILLCTFFLADLLALLAGRYIPEPPVMRSPRTAFGVGSGKKVPAIEDYNVIFARNLFNSKGVIPGDEAPAGNTGPQDQGGPPVKTNLPFNLIGTLILRDELRSIATIEDKTASMVYPVRAEDEIPGKARILKVEPTRVIFVNTASGRREFVELPENMMLPEKRVTLGGPSRGGGIEQLSANQFNVSRVEVDRALSDLNNILTQARAVPNFENGQPAGYKLFQIVPGSIYDKLGLKNGDIITGLDNQPINDPGKAFEMLSRLKESNHLDLKVKRDGRESNFAYDIR